MIKKIWMVIGILSIACLPAISQKKENHARGRSATLL